MVVATACVDMGEPAPGDEESGSSAEPSYEAPGTVGIDSPARHTVVETEHGRHVVAYEVRDSRAVIEGDIDIGAADVMVDVAPDFDVKEDVAEAWTSIYATKWPNSTVFYQPPDINVVGSIRFNAIYAAIAELQSDTHMNFQATYTGGNRIVFLAVDGASSSPVGRQGGVQYVRVGRGTNLTRTVVHELMHAAGFYHEQSRTDRDSYIDINWPCIEAGREHNFYSVTGLSSVNYDVNSIMHYGPTAFMRAGCSWTIRRDDGVPLTPDPHLTSKDITSVNLWY